MPAIKLPIQPLRYFFRLGLTEPCETLPYPSAVLPINRKTVCLALLFPSIDYYFLGIFNVVSMIKLVMADIPIPEKLFHVFPKPFFTGKFDTPRS